MRGVVSLSEPRTQASRALDRYALFQEIASGALATVHLGRLARGGLWLPWVFAIKRLHPQFAKDPDFVKMFMDEARIAMYVHHANVEEAFELIALEGEVLLVMEYLHGESLARLMRRAASLNERIAPPIVASIVAGVLHGLHAAHVTKNDRGEPLAIVHRDISPQNVLVGVDGIARVLDFAVPTAVGRLQTTREGQVKGKRAYMSPEQVLGHAVDARTDVYAAGVIAWEALAGRGLHRGNNEGIMLAGVAEPPSCFAPDLPPAWDDIVMRALSVDPADRYESAHAMAAAIEASVPCAPAREVAAWVARIAAEELEKRAAAVAAVERAAATPDALAGAVAVVDAPRAPAADRPAPAARRYVRAAVAAAALAGGALLAVRMAPGSKGDAPATATDAPAADAPATATDAPAAAGSRAALEPAASAPAEAAASADGAVNTARTASGTSAASARAATSATSAAGTATTTAEAPPVAAPPRRAAPAPAAPKAPAGAARARPGCTDPFVADANGVLRVRRECR
ncbi:serine/threonine-protein kinase [Sorangium sp. So ce1000]|uniref:serine/threonine-protein kinase n=1 Tax=Sorangium sp. So ce1000 TaxID=3133325 RepID=UPI003F6356D2